ncbi:MAG TPA: UPF0104 family protein, partial [Ramlibacter sp.]
MANGLPRNALVKPRRRSGSASPDLRPIRSRLWWDWSKRALSLLFFAAVAWLLVSYAKHLDWHKVLDSLEATPPPVLLAAFLLAAASHLLYSTYDLIGRRYTGHTLP